MDCMKVKAHDVRGFAASWARTSNVSLESIMLACSWKSHNTFTHYYLKDLARIQDEMFKLGPVVIARHVTAKVSQCYWRNTGGNKF